MLICVYVILLQRPINTWAEKCVRLWWVTTSRWFYRKFHFTWEKKWLVTARNLQSIKTFVTLGLSQYSKSGSTFPSSELVAAVMYIRQSFIMSIMCYITPHITWQNVVIYNMLCTRLFSHRTVRTFFIISYIFSPKATQICFENMPWCNIL